MRTPARPRTPCVWPLIIALFYAYSCRCPNLPVSSLKEWGLPLDLAEKQEQLTEITLPASVNRLDWLSTRIIKVNAENTQIETLTGLPPSVRELDIRGAIKLRDLNGLPSSLKVLKISGENLEKLDFLPTSLTELHLQDATLRDLTGLPAGLKTVVLSGPGIHDLNGLPEGLQALTLHGTHVKTLKGLPDSLQRLVLVANLDLEIKTEDFPPRLTYLVVDDELVSKECEWRRLRYLCCLSDRSEYPRQAWPEFLSALILRATNLTEAPKIPETIRNLGLIHYGISDSVHFPAGLESLDLTDCRCPEVAGLPEGLKSLKLNDSSIRSLPRLPLTLEALDISNTEVTDLAGLPRGLKSLVFRGATRRRLEEVEKLPNLERLDIAWSSVEDLGKLPPRLRYLNVRGTKIKKITANEAVDLKELDISSTQLDWKFISQLPKNLEVLTLSQKQIDRLTDLPTSVRALHFVY